MVRSHGGRARTEAVDGALGCRRCRRRSNRARMHLPRRATAGEHGGRSTAEQLLRQPTRCQASRAAWRVELRGHQQWRQCGHSTRADPGHAPSEPPWRGGRCDKAPGRRAQPLPAWKPGCPSRITLILALDPYPGRVRPLSWPGQDKAPKKKKPGRAPG